MYDSAQAQLTNRWLWALCLVLGIALVARLWGVAYGLPFSYWNDEYHELMRAMQLGAGSFNFARTTKGGFYLLLFFEYGVYFVVLKLMGIVSNTKEFAESFVRDPTMFYLIGRSTAAVLGCITVAAVFWIARHAYSVLAGLLAAFLLAINVLHIDLSHRIGVDIPMAMFAALSLYFGLRIAETGGRRNYVLAAVFAALATTSKLPGILVLLPLLIAHTYATARAGGGIKGWFRSRELWVSVAVFAAVLLATDPGVIFFTGIGSHLSGSAGDSGDLDDLDALAEQALVGRPNLYVFYVGVLLKSMGWPLFIFSIVAIGYALWKRCRADVMLVSYAIVNYFAIATTSSETLYYPRYALPIVVVLAVLAGRAISDFMNALPRWRPAVGAVSVTLLAAWPVWTAVVADHALTLTDTRTIAKNWFEDHVPSGAKVLVEGGKTGPQRETVQLRESRASLKRRIDYWKVVEPRQARFLEIKLAIQDDAGYDLELVRLQSISSLDQYAEKGIEYFVVRPQTFTLSRKADARAPRLLQDLRNDPRVTLLHKFAPESPSHPGVTVEVYHLALTGPSAMK